MYTYTRKPGTSKNTIVAIYTNSKNCGVILCSIALSILLYSCFYSVVAVVVFVRFEYSRDIKWRSTFLYRSNSKNESQNDEKDG